MSRKPLVAASLILLAAALSACSSSDPDRVACASMVKSGLRPVADAREDRFLGKVQEDTARCRGGEQALASRATPWLDWSSYWATGDQASQSGGKAALTSLGAHLEQDGRGVDGALLDLEYQRIELITFNLFDSATFEDYLQGRDGVGGRALKTWPEMRLPADDPAYAAVGGAGEQLCQGPLIRHRTLTGICNDLRNPAMGSSGQRFARNVEFEETFPELSDEWWVRNRHGERLGLLEPDPQVVSRKLFTRAQAEPWLCNQGQGLPGFAAAARCDYQKAPFFNVLAAYWIQFMTHDWFSHLDEARNAPATMPVGCASQKVAGVERPLTPAETAALGCRPADRMEQALVADQGPPDRFEHDGRSRLERPWKTTRNSVTAWWDASQIYGYDERSRARIKRDPADAAKLQMVAVIGRSGAGDRYGYLPTYQSGADPIQPEWAGQEAVAFPDNWTIGLSFLHNVFVREHNLFVDAFRARARQTPAADSGLRDPAAPAQVITYAEVDDEELFEVGRLVVAAEIAKIHTIEWTPQLLYDEPLAIAMDSNWNGLFKAHPRIERALAQVVARLARSEDEVDATQWYSVFATGPGIIGTGSTARRLGEDRWSLARPDDVNGGLNHFGSPFNFPEEFITVYRLHALLPDLLEVRDLDADPDAITSKVPVIDTFRGQATAAMHGVGLSSWALSLGRQRLGALALQNHPQFLQNLVLGERLDTPTRTIDVAALDIIRDRERGVPRFNEFRRQYGLKQLTGFDDFIDQHLAAREDLTPQEQATLAEQQQLVLLLREVYGTHRCDAARIISLAQTDPTGTLLEGTGKRFPNDCLGHPDGSEVDNIEDLDTIVGWHAETTRPHGFAISETQFQVFILNASRRLYSDRFFTSSFRPEFYGTLGIAWVQDNGPDGKQWEPVEVNGRRQEVSPFKRVLLRTMPELSDELAPVVNAFDPWARERGDYYTLEWQPREDAAADESFAAP
jgi:hypothetical protein